MSALQANTTPPIRPPSETPEGQPAEDGSESRDALAPGRPGAQLGESVSQLLLSAPKDAREIVRLIQCGVCSSPFREPTTLPCGQSLCKQCIPEVHVRTNISWPATATRRHGFQCPFAECGKDHAIGDCSTDVTLNKALASICAALEQERGAMEDSLISTQVTVCDGWGAAGVPSLQEKDNDRRTAKGGPVWSTYSLVEGGQLEYSSEVVYSSFGAPAAEVAELDAAGFLKLKESARPEMDCQVCYALFLDPVTTTCGHTFCRACLHRVLDHSHYCPICRRALTVQSQLNPSSCPSNQRLNKIINGFWADTVALRANAARLEQQANGDYDIPIFVCTLSFPSMPMFLHVFEPRYRLMIRRAMETTQTFGMVTYREPAEPGGMEFMEIGTLLRIVSLEYFPDGRSLLETTGVSRFRVTRHGMVDGYVVGNIEKMDDISLADEEDMEVAETLRGQGVRDFAPPEPGPDGAAPAAGAGDAAAPRNAHVRVEDLETMATRELLDLGVDFVRRMRGRSASWLAARTLAIYGECPNDPATFPWWLASVLPVTDDEKYRMLGTSSVRQRLKICCRWAIEWESSRWTLSDCLVF